MPGVSSSMLRVCCLASRYRLIGCCLLSWPQQGVAGLAEVRRHSPAVCNTRAIANRLPYQVCKESYPDCELSASHFCSMALTDSNAIQTRLGIRKCYRPVIACCMLICRSSQHPYYDRSSNKDKPTWYMVSANLLEYVVQLGQLTAGFSMLTY